MPPKKNKKTPAPNGFYYFMLQFKNSQGRNFKSMVEVSEAAGPHWARMSKEQRRPFEEQARFEKTNSKAAKCTSEGLDVDRLEREQREAQQNEELMKQDIKTTLLISKKAGSIDTDVFYIVHMNSFCVEENSGTYYPAEIAICGFNLADGVQEEHCYHSIIKPGPLPLGYAHIAKLHTSQTHQLELPSIGESYCNTTEVFHEIFEFLAGRLCGSKRLPILYATEKNWPMVVQVFEQWCYDFKQDVDLVKIYKLEYLLFSLYNVTVPNNDEWLSLTHAYNVISKDHYCYTGDIACEFHEESDCVIHCSRSVVVRLGYTICDHCCKNLDIEVLPGYHVPSKALVKGSTSSRSSTKSSYTHSSKTSSQFSVRGDDSSDTETVISFGKSSKWDETASNASSSANLGDLDGFPQLGSQSEFNSQNESANFDWNSFTPPVSSQRSYSGASGGSGFSKRPPALPATLTHGSNTISTGVPKDDFPPIGAGWGRGRNNPFVPRGRGGPWVRNTNPFKPGVTSDE